MTKGASGERSPRTLSDDLRRRTDSELADLLEARADLLDPIPTNLSQLSANAASSVSVLHALDGLDRPALEVLDTLAAMAPGPTLADLAATAGIDLTDEASSDLLVNVVERLRQRALVWGDSPQRSGAVLHIVVAVREVLRGGKIHTPIELELAEPTGEFLMTQEVCDRAAAERAYAALVAIEALCDYWSIQPPPVLRNGALGQRSLSEVATELGCDERLAHWWIELTVACGLLARDGAADEMVRPTVLLHEWLEQSPHLRWALVAASWLSTSRMLSIGAQQFPPLSPAATELRLPSLRRDVVEVLSSASEGTRVNLDSVVALIDDRRPRRAGPVRNTFVEGICSEMELLGITSMGVLATAGRVLVGSGPDPDVQAVGAAISAFLPAMVDHFFLQGDLTVVVPGPPQPTMRTALNALADVESTGGAVVYRITPKSLERAINDGWSEDSIRDVLREYSRTPVPQALDYLIADAQRRHGEVRIGAASSFISSEDEAVIADLLADPKAKSLGLVAISKTAAASRVAPATLLKFVQERGISALVQAVDGELHSAQSLVPDTSPPIARPSEPPSSSPRPDPILIDAVIRALRSGEANLHGSPTPETREHNDKVPLSKAARPAHVPRMPMAQTATILRRVMSANGSVWIGYADNAGSTTARLLDPVRIEGGYISAFDHRTGQVRSFAISRITGAVPLEESP